MTNPTPTNDPQLFTRREYHVLMLQRTGMNLQVAENVTQGQVDEQPDLDWDAEKLSWDDWGHADIQELPTNVADPITDEDNTNGSD